MSTGHLSLVPDNQSSDMFFPVALVKPVLEHAGTAMVGHVRRPVTHKFRDENNRAVCRLDSSGDVTHVFGYVTSRYKLVTHKEMFDLLDAAVAKVAKHFGVPFPVTEDQVAYFGKQAYRTYKFEMPKSVGNDTLRPTLIAGNGYTQDPVWSYGGSIISHCTNGMLIGDCLRLSFRHTKNLDMDEVVQQMIDTVAATLKGYSRLRKWNETPLNIDIVETFLLKLEEDGFINSKVSHIIFRRYGEEESQIRGMNLWALHNAMTWWATHWLVPDRQNNNIAAAVHMQRHELVRRITMSKHWARLEGRTS